MTISHGWFTLPHLRTETSLRSLQWYFSQTLPLSILLQRYLNYFFFLLQLIYRRNSLRPSFGYCPSSSQVLLPYSVFLTIRRPEHIEPLRVEISSVVAEYGWSKDAIRHMVKLDSFVKETQRLSPIGSGTSKHFFSSSIIFTVHIPDALQRKAVQDFTFSDGLFIPAGTYMVAHVYAMHRDPAVYEDPLEFKGFRFAEKRSGPSGEITKHQVVNTSLTYLPFGHGKHAWLVR